jgi:hypothetical protein
VYNRSAEKAQALARRFGGMAISDLHHNTIRDAVGQWAPDVIISTIPGIDIHKLWIIYDDHNTVCTALLFA